MTSTQQDTLDAALRQAFQVCEEPPLTLTARLESEVSRLRPAQLKRQAPSRLARRGLALVSVAAATAFALVMAPKILVRRALAQMVSAAENVRSLHRVGWIVDGQGNRHKADEAWFQDGHWRLESPRGVQIYTAGRNYFYDPGAHLATWRAAEGAFANNPSGFSIRSMMADLTRWGWSDKITLSPEEQVLDGRRARVATIEPAHENIRIVLYASPNTLLPFRMDLLKPTLNGWKLSQTSTMEYNLPLRASLFEPKFPAGTHLMREGEGREEWARSLQKPEATLLTRDQRIVIRDASMNERGDVFVLFTSGRERDVDPGPAVMLVADKPALKLAGAGSEFVPLSTLLASPSRGFYAQADGPDVKKKIEGVRVDDEPLQWAVWTRIQPLTPAQAAQPQRVSLQVVSNGNSSKGNSSSGKAFDRHFEVPQARAVTLTMARATADLVPGYVRYFPGGLDEADLLNATDQARADAFGFSQNARPQQRQQALTLYRTIIERTEQDWREQGNQGVQPDKWLAVAELCLKLKRRDEAGQALTRAEEEDQIYGNAKADIARLKQQMQDG